MCINVDYLEGYADTQWGFRDREALGGENMGPYYKYGRYVFGYFCSPTFYNPIHIQHL